MGTFVFQILCVLFFVESFTSSPKGSDDKDGAVIIEGREVAEKAATEVAAAHSDCIVLEISKPFFSLFHLPRQRLHRCRR